MKELNPNDPRIVYFFNSLGRITSKLEDLLGNYKPIFNGERYITDEELSNRLNIHRRTLNDYRKKGILPYIYFGGKVLYPENEILKILENRIIRPTKSYKILR